VVRSSSSGDIIETKHTSKNTANRNTASEATVGHDPIAYQAKVTTESRTALPGQVGKVRPLLHSQSQSLPRPSQAGSSNNNNNMGGASRPTSGLPTNSNTNVKARTVSGGDHRNSSSQNHTNSHLGHSSSHADGRGGGGGGAARRGATRSSRLTEERLTAAAIRIQCCCRGRIARRRVAAVRRQRLFEVTRRLGRRAATYIQRM
jgi:hypothetical protein